MLFGRTKELTLLEDLYNSNCLNVVFITGEIGSNLNELLTEFATRKKTAFYKVRQGTENSNEAAFALEISEQSYGNGVFKKWEDALEQVCRKSLGEKILLIVNEANLLSAHFKGFTGRLYEFLSDLGSSMRLTIVFAGSNKEFYKDEVFKGFKNYSSHIISIGAISFFDARNYLKMFTPEEGLLLYGVTGGYPLYLSQIDPDISLKDNLMRLFYSEKAIFKNLSMDLLRHKLREPAVYSTILCSIAHGAVRLNDIADAVGVESNKLSKYLNVLVDMGFLERVIPVTEQNVCKQHKRSFYRIGNTLLEFWYVYVYPYLSLIEIGRGSNVLRTKIFPKLDKFEEKIYIKVCLQYCQYLKEKKDFYFDFEQLGYCWNKNIPLENAIIMAYNGKKACLISCFWNKTKIDIDCLKVTEKCLESFGFTTVYTVVFSRKGFTDRLLNFSAINEDVRLISFHYMK